jgi:hypothetical protein
MIKAVVKFFGAERDQFGMPVPYHSYLIVSSPWEMPGSGIASVVPLSVNAPLSKPHFPVLQGGGSVLHLMLPYKRFRMSQRTLALKCFSTKVNSVPQAKSS